jgi:hypothetical protein
MALSIPPPTQMLTDSAIGRITEPWYRIFTGLVTDANLSRRTVLTEDSTFYVRPGGSDDTGDGSANDDAHAFATPHGAYTYLLENVDAAGYFIKIKMAAGTYTATSHRRTTTESSSETTVVTLNEEVPGAAMVVFEGDQTTPTNVIWDAAGNFCVYAPAGAGIWRFEGIAFRDLSAAAGSKALFSNASGANYSFDDVDFGEFGSTHIHLYGPNIVKIFGDYTISGGANRHLWLEGGGAAADLESHTVTITNTPDFSTGFVVVAGTCNLFSLSQTFSGSATGVRYKITDLSVITTGGGGVDDLDAYFPGDTQGTVLHRVSGNGEINAVNQDGAGATSQPAIQELGRNAANSSMVLGRWSADAFGPQIVLLKSRASSVGGTTAPSSGDEMGRIAFHSRDTTSTAVAGGIRALCAGTASSNDAPTNLEFGTTPDGSGGTDTTWRWRIDLNGHLYPLSDIAYDVGSSTLGVRNIYLGTSGDALGRTQTWTPTILFGGLGTDVAYTTRIGRYVLVGDMLTIWASIVLSSNGSVTGNAQISGIPYDCITLAGYEAVGTFGGYANISETARNYHCSIQSADTRIDLLKGDGADASTFLTETDIDDDAKFNICLSYLVA